MLDKKTNQTDNYKLNDKTTLSVKNVRDEDDFGNISYKTQVTLKHKHTRKDPLSFSSSDEIEEFVASIDLQDQQLTLEILDANPMK